MVMHFLNRDERVCSLEDGLGFGVVVEKNLGTGEGLSRCWSFEFRRARFVTVIF